MTEAVLNTEEEFQFPIGVEGAQKPTASVEADAVVNSFHGCMENMMNLGDSVICLLIRGQGSNNII